MLQAHTAGYCNVVTAETVTWSTKKVTEMMGLRLDRTSLRHRLFKWALEILTSVFFCQYTILSVTFEQLLWPYSEAVQEVVQQRINQLKETQKEYYSVRSKVPVQVHYSPPPSWICVPKNNNQKTETSANTPIYTLSLSLTELKLQFHICRGRICKNGLKSMQSHLKRN